MRQDLEQSSDQRYTTYRYLNLEIDPGVPAITRAGQPIELRAKALTLLMFLLEQRHRIVSKEEIFERVWPEHGRDGRHARRVHSGDPPGPRR